LWRGRSLRAADLVRIALIHILLTLRSENLCAAATISDLFQNRRERSLPVSGPRDEQD